MSSAAGAHERLMLVVAACSFDRDRSLVLLSQLEQLAPSVSLRLRYLAAGDAQMLVEDIAVVAEGCRRSIENEPAG